MFQFEHPIYLWLLFVVVIFAAIDWWFSGMKSTAWVDEELKERMSLGYSKLRLQLRRLFISLAMIFLIIALANPQWGTKREKVQSKGSDIIIALDISQSMMCEDIAPNRLERSKRFSEKLLGRLKGERVGVILFAGSAYLQMPMTTDYAAAALFIKAANTRLAASQGTAIGDAINLAKTVFGNEDQYHKALIVITDGETHDDAALEEASTAAERDMILFFVGVGSQEGGFIPVEYNGRLDYIRDDKGDFVKSKLNEDLMRSLSDEGNGAYYNIVGGDQILEELDRRIDQLEKKELEQRSFEQFESYFPIAILVSLFFWLLVYLVNPKKNEKWGW